jgi:hypothetical protein
MYRIILWYNNEAVDNGVNVLHTMKMCETLRYTMIEERTAVGERNVYSS